MSKKIYLISALYVFAVMIFPGGLVQSAQAATSAQLCPSGQTLTGNPPECKPSTGIVQCGGPGQQRCDKFEFYALISRLFKFFVFISGILVVLAIGVGGLFMLISAGSEDRLSYGKQTIKAAILGFIMVLVAWIIVNTIITVFTNCEGSWYVFEEFKCGEQSTP